jgi:beta-N-acetylhexosaminidase
VRNRRSAALAALLVLSVVLAVALVSCSAQPSPAATHTASSASAHRKPASPPPDPIANMSLAQRVGQLFMVGTNANVADGVTLDAIADSHVGNVFLAGRSHLGVAAIVAQLQAEVNLNSTDSEPLFVATDQEGGEVQVLQGPGFSAMPTGLAQGGMAPAALRAAASLWGAQLHAAGVNMNLAPVVDLLPSLSAAPLNLPIGVFSRELGFTPASITAHADAFRSAMSANHVVSVLKHFPGLGHVDANTDTASNVTDSVVTAGGPDVGIYRSEIASGARCVMVSLAVYSQLDPNEPAVFSPKVVSGLLRTSLGFNGVIMTDDLSATAQVAYLSPADRAIDAISAGVDIVLVSASPEQAAGMVAAVLAKAQADPAFAAIVSTAARRVVELKQAALPLAADGGIQHPQAPTDGNFTPLKQ